MERNPYAPPESKVEAATEPGELEERPPRGGCLTALLAVMIAGNVLMTGIYTVMLLSHAGLPGGRAWLGPLLLFVGTVNVVSLVAIWMWQRWGFYVVAASAGSIFIMNIGLGANLFMALAGMIGPALIFMLMKPMWKHFE